METDTMMARRHPQNGTGRVLSEKKSSRKPVARPSIRLAELDNSHTSLQPSKPSDDKTAIQTLWLCAFVMNLRGQFHCRNDRLLVIATSTFVGNRNLFPPLDRNSNHSTAIFRKQQQQQRSKPHTGRFLNIDAST